ncbi:MFS transporter [Rhodococcus sp. 077-4]|uniref:MFS transporter n=1 Tax=Rhodococcus sp. 077-4 TaxID=2789271 RepID=UPI0039F565C5
MNKSQVIPESLTERAPTRPPGVTYVLAAGIFLMGTTEFMIAGLLPDVAADLDVDVARAGLLITAFAVGMIVGPPVMALVTMRLPPRTTLVVSLLVFAIGHVVGATSTSFHVVTASRVLTALATGTFWAVAAVMALRLASPGTGARAMAVLSSGLGLAVVAGVPLGTFAGQITGWRGPFWILAVLATIAAFVVRRVAPNDAIRTDISVAVAVSTVRRWRMWVVLAAIVLAQAGFLGAYSYITPLLTDRSGIAPALVPLILVGFGIGGLLGNAVAGRTGGRYPIATIAIAVAVTSIGLAALAFWAGHPTIAAALIVVLGASGLGANPVLIAETMRHADGDSPLASALATAAFNLGTAGGSAVAGLTLSTSLSTSGPAVMGAVVTVTALVPIAVLTVENRRASARRDSPTG